MYHHNSTIRIKTGVCELCSDGKEKPLTKGLCATHYSQQSKMRSVRKFQEKENEKNDGLPELIEEADILFSRYIRLSAADEKGMLTCYICDTAVHYKRAQAMHFISRGNLFLRYDPRNVRAGCQLCNEVKGGNLVLFARKLNQEQFGLAEILMEESHLVLRSGRDEVRQVILEYSQKLKELLKNK